MSTQLTGFSSVSFSFWHWFLLSAESLKATAGTFSNLSCRAICLFFLADVNKGSKTIEITPKENISTNWSYWKGLLRPSANCWSESHHLTQIPACCVLSRIDNTSIAVLRSSNWRPEVSMRERASKRFLLSRIKTEGISFILESIFFKYSWFGLNHSRKICFMNSWLSVAFDAICTSADVEDLAIRANFLDCHDKMEYSLRLPWRTSISANKVIWPPCEDPSILHAQLASVYVIKTGLETALENFKAVSQWCLCSRTNLLTWKASAQQ